MGDHSSATRFQIGDSVVVVDDVMKMGRNLKGLDGIVVETWEKCDVDPTKAPLSILTILCVVFLPIHPLSNSLCVRFNICFAGAAVRNGLMKGYQCT